MNKTLEILGEEKLATTESIAFHGEKSTFLC